MLVLKGHTPRQTVYALAFSPDGGSLASCSLDGTVRLWDLRTGEHRIVAKTSGFMTRSLEFAPDGHTLAWPDQAHVRLELVASTGCVTLNPPHGGWPSWKKVRFSPDGRAIAAVGMYITLWELSSRRALAVWAEGTESKGLAFAPDGRTLAVGHSHRNRYSGRYRHEVTLYDPDTREARATLTAKRSTTDLAFAPDGRTLAGACEEFLSVWHPLAAEPVFQNRSDNRHFQCVAFTPDGRFLAAAHNDRTVRLWDTRGWEERAAFDWGIGEVVCVAFSPDGMRAAAGGRSGRIVLWDVDL